jgi:hypothetical protein
VGGGGWRVYEERHSRFRDNWDPGRHSVTGSASPCVVSIELFIDGLFFVRQHLMLPRSLPCL